MNEEGFLFFFSLTLIHFFGHGLGEGLSTVLICLLHLPLGFPGGLVVKNLPANAGDAGSISGSERFPGEGDLQGTFLKMSSILAWRIPMDRGAWSMGSTKREYSQRELQSMGSQSWT